MAELEKWAADAVGQSIPSCEVCGRAADAVRSAAIGRIAPAAEGRFQIHGPLPGRAVVEARADASIPLRHPGEPAWQKRLRAEMVARCSQLEPSAGQLLHAAFFGEKRSNADVENVVLYNIGSFRVAGRNGIRFELGGTAPPPGPEGAQFPFGYRYALAPRSGTFVHWRPGRTLASFGWTDLGGFVGQKQAVQVWWALTRGQIDVATPACASETPFAVKIELRPPRGAERVLGGMVKGIFDGVICALQAHTDTTVLPDVVPRIAAAASADPAEIEERLLDQSRAVLGVVPQLVDSYRGGFKWDPADHWCVAGELLPAEPVGQSWAIRGEVVELSR